MVASKIIKFCDYLIESGLLAIIFFVPIIFDFTALSYNVVDLYKAIVFRIILIFILLAWSAKVFLAGRLSYRGSSKIFLFTGFLLLSFFISSIFSLNPSQSFWGNFFRQQGFYNYFHYLLFFSLLILNIDGFKQIRRIIIAAVVSASLTSVYGLIQYFNLDPASWLEKAADSGRVFSSLGQPSWFGHYLILVLPLSLYSLIFLARSFLARFLAGLAVLLELACLILTYSRAAWLGFLASMVFLTLAWLIRKRFKKIAFSFVGLLLVGAIAVAVLNIIKSSDQNNLYAVNLAGRIKSLSDFSGGSSKMRLYYLESAVKEIKQASYLRLSVGFGPEILAGIFIKYYRPDWGINEAVNGYPDRVHNWFFDQALSLGLLGLTANLAFYLYLIYKAALFFRVRPNLGSGGWLAIFLFSSLAAYFINNLFSFSLLTNYVYLFLILAVIWLIINREEGEKEISVQLTNFSKLLIWASLLAASAVFIWTNNINQARAEIYYLKALKSINVSDCQSVLDNITKTVNLSPNNNYYQEQYLFLLLNCFPSVDKKTQIEFHNNLLSRIESLGHPELYGLRSNLARAYTLFGFYLDKDYYRQADETYNGLIADFPYFIIAYEDWGRQKMMQEDYAGAINVYKRALEILPSPDHPALNVQHRAQIAAIAVRLDESLGQAYFKMKNYDLAIDYYKKGLALNPYQATLYKAIADVYYIQGRLVEAIALNQRGLTLNPGDYHWPLQLSLLYREKKDLEKAKAYLDQALKLAPENEGLKKYKKELNEIKK